MKKKVNSPSTSSGLKPHERFQDWPTLLFHLIEARRNVPFAWGRQDCCLFACDGILAQTGLDPAAGMFRGKYRDALGAARLLKKHGGVEAIAVKVCSGLGYAPVPVSFAQRGDVVLVELDEQATPLPAAAGPGLVRSSRPLPRGETAAKATGNPGHGPALGLCIGAEAAFPGPAGLILLPVSACRRAWAVGRPAPLPAPAGPGFVPPESAKPGQRRVG